MKHPFNIIKELIQNLDDRHWRRSRIQHRIIMPFQQKIYPRYKGSTRVMEEDWDNLIILDGCRADLFEEVVDTGQFDNYSRVRSLGGATGEWTTRNFANSNFADTVYVSANPNPSRLAGANFHELIEVWRDHFDREQKTVYPQDVITEAKKAHEEFYDKRLIFHFMQPHRPFIDNPELQFESWVPEDRDPKRPYGPWEALEMGLVDKDDVWEGYSDNLEYVFTEIQEFLTGLDGRTIITSDHGNLVGERSWPIPIRLYGHQSGLRVPELITVPWAVIEGEQRRDILAEDTRSVSAASEREIQNRLQDLGYVD